MFKSAKPDDIVKVPRQVLSALQGMAQAFPDLMLFIQIVLTVPVAPASAERSSSALKRVKTYLRSTMSQSRLNSLCMLAIEREQSELLLWDPRAVVDKFASMKPRRLLRK